MEEKKNTLIEDKGRKNMELTERVMPGMLSRLWNLVKRDWYEYIVRWELFDSQMFPCIFKVLQK